MLQKIRFLGTEQGLQQRRSTGPPHRRNRPAKAPGIHGEHQARGGFCGGQQVQCPCHLGPQTGQNRLGAGDAGLLLGAALLLAGRPSFL
ncbi:MAG: hypothetical protein ACK56I_16305, partial [bacterium]